MLLTADSYLCRASLPCWSDGSSGRLVNIEESPAGRFRDTSSAVQPKNELWNNRNQGLPMQVSWKGLL